MVYRRMTNDSNPVVSVIVPARNEEACLRSCLESIVTQSGISFEVIVVDDASTDQTAEIARSFSINHVGAEPAQSDRPAEGSRTGALTRPTQKEGVRGYVGNAETNAHVLSVTVISAPPLPEGWTGKNNAMSAGARIAKGKWLLFTDADTVHKPGSLAGAVAEAEEHGAALFSYSPEQEVRTFWEKAVMPVIFAELAATYPPSKVNDPTSPIAAANGQYLMISREAYDAVSGHTKIAGDLLEDVAMARQVKSSRRKIFFRYGGDAVRTRMYRSWSQMKEGWTKNLALLFKNPTGRAFMLLGYWVLAWFTFLLGLAAIGLGYWRAAFYLLPLVFWYGRIASGQFRAQVNFVGITFGVPLVAYLLVRSAMMHKHTGVMWKGRGYGSRHPNAVTRDIHDRSTNVA
jgi:glycosyltransferase involved in cell wall biosynthesis